MRRHRLAFGDAPNYREALDVGGELAFRVNGERHVWTSDTVALLQHAVRGNNYRKFKEFTRRVGDQEEGARSRCAACSISASRPKPDSARRGRARGEHRQALLHRRHVLRLDLVGGAHHARHRHEPHGRPLEHRRGRRGSAALQAARRTAIRCARRSSRWRRAGSASTPNTSSTPTCCRSRWRRARSPARAASSPATRSMTGSRACATRSRASD